ncbi:MAG: PD-(D/E)XK nuclease family protein [Bacteroidota bacterium]
MALQSSFLADLAAELYARHHAHFSELTIVLPNGRADRVLRKQLASHFARPMWAPQILSINQFLQQHSPLQQVPSLELTYELYQTFQTLLKEQEVQSFEQLYFWFHLLVQDFDVVDKYLVNAAHLFTDLSQQKELSLSHDYLTEAQRAAIQAFWRSFEQRLSADQEGFLELWKQLPRLYEAFRQRLQQKGIGYQGMCYRAAYEALRQGDVALQYKHLVFAGFNALTPVEEQILAWYQANRAAEFYWDVDAYYMEDAQQEAGKYLRAYQERPYFQASFVRPLPERLAAPGKEIQVTAVASEVGQAQVVGAQLGALIEAQGDAFVPHKTAIVVANEALFLPVLHALPLAPKQVSMKLGYPLKETTSYQLMEHLLALQIAAAQADVPKGYLVKQHVLATLQNAHVLAWEPETVQVTLEQLQATSSTYVSQDSLTEENYWYEKLFKALQPSDSWLTYLIEVLSLCRFHVSYSLSLNLEAKALEHLLQQMNRLQELLGGTPISGEEFLRLFRQLVHDNKLSLDPQPQEGVQVLDVMATQNLDFDQVFIVGMNEGHFPVQSNPSSFIPYNLRKGYGLPTADEHQAALYAYHFYRLLQRAQKVYITYSTASTGGSPGEMSRYLWQLLYEAKLPLKKQVMAQPIYLTEVKPIVIAKNEQIRQQLQQFVIQADGTAQPLSPSALNTYLDCRLRFYFQYLAQLKAPPEPQQATHPLVFGNLLHEAMEKLYAPLLQQSQPLQPQDLKALKKMIKAIVQAVFTHTFSSHPGAGLQGDQAIAQAVITKLIDRIVALDQGYAPFMLVGLELGRQKPLLLDFALDADTRVRLRGIIDRVDWKEGVFRVLDYKTGTDKKQFKGTPALFAREDPHRNKAAFQTFFYAWLFQQQGLEQVVLPAGTEDAQQVMPGLINTRQLFDDDFDPRFFIQSEDSRKYIPVETITPYRMEWEEGLRQLLAELLDPAVPFTQTEDATKCTSCPYKGICQRY